MDETPVLTNLRHRMVELSNHLMPPEFDDFSNYEEKYYDMARGYCLLVHAELESYFEKICTAYIDIKVQEFTSNSELNEVVMAIVLLYSHEPDTTEDDVFRAAFNKMRKCKSSKVNERVNVFKASFKDVVKDNHGIKKADLKKLFLPTGFLHKVEGMFDDFDSFGSDRGSIAHTSATPRIRENTDPKLYYNKVFNQLIPSVERIDRIFVEKDRALTQLDYDRI